MKKNTKTKAALAALCCSALLLNSCVYDLPVYGGVTLGNSYGSISVRAWSPASYDAGGFPIFGYYSGRPVYGYTPEGAAVYTLAALTAACLVPHWSPAPWYRGHWHYPSHIRRVSVPPHCPHDHFPALRPHGGMHAPVHFRPHSVMPGHPSPIVHPNLGPGAPLFPHHR